ncbi:MAG: alpha-E domain-containing protein [Candidatus Nitronauta litoralis]|uniref:Alpha-E domain-containing protein n=1 Tax=Candidatus Nitronauta litoralis TaxID=2705533 RepID=A0A7T0G0Z5_9BACT|nr:MAG: alpha-E domain-containing protein [Candidatus Nitronauta litoralis]
MLSRVANALYWMNRYLERAENTARIIESQLHMLLDLPSMRKDPNAWKPLVDITGDAKYFTENIGDYTRENVIFFHTFDNKYPHSITSCLTAARENARSVREIIPSEMWEKINNLYLGIAEPGADEEAGRSPHKFYYDIKMSCHLIIGIAYSTMAHGEAWHFSQLGRYLERADKTSRILDVKYFIILPRVDYVGSSLDNVQWTALLKSTSSLEMYRKRFNLISSNNIVDFLIFDRVFPRSVLYCINHAEQSLSKIYGASDELSSSSSLYRLMGKLKGKVNYSHIDEVMDIGLHQFLDGIQYDLNTVGEEIHENFFALKKVSDSSSIGAQVQ